MQKANGNRVHVSLPLNYEGLTSKCLIVSKERLSPLIARPFHRAEGAAPGTARFSPSEPATVYSSFVTTRKRERKRERKRQGSWQRSGDPPKLSDNCRDPNKTE